MKRGVLGLGAAVLALAAGAFALTTRDGGENVRQIVTTVPSRAGAVTPASTAPPAPSVAQRTRIGACQSDTSDATGDDCATAPNDDQAGDSPAGESEPDENDNGN
jgi:hypothetical protein